jgi:hypothetical protein
MEIIKRSYLLANKMLEECSLGQSLLSMAGHASLCTWTAIDPGLGNQFCLRVYMMLYELQIACSHKCCSDCASCQKPSNILLSCKHAPPFTDMLM